jgi:hypothetical protein
VFFPIGEVQILLIFNAVAGSVLLCIVAIDWRFYRTHLLTALSYAIGLFILTDNTFLSGVFISTQWAKYQHSPVNVSTLTLYEAKALQETVHNFSVMDDVRSMWYAALVLTVVTAACYITTKPFRVQKKAADVETPQNLIANITPQKKKKKSRLVGAMLSKLSVTRR